MSVSTIRGAQIRGKRKNRKVLHSLHLGHLIRESDVNCKSELCVNLCVFTDIATYSIPIHEVHYYVFALFYFYVALFK